MKTKLACHSSKVWHFIYPIYAREILTGRDYEKLAGMIGQDFDLTPDQWQAVLSNWEFIRDWVIANNQ